MCDPVSLAVTAIATTATLGFMSSNAQYEGQTQAAEAHQEYQVTQQRQREEQIQENYDRTLESYRFQLGSEQVRIEEVRKAAAQQIFNVNQSALQQRSSAAASAASRGAAGQSTYLSLLNYITQAGVQVGGIETQLKAEQSQSERNKQAMYMEAKARAKSIQPYIPAPIQGPTDTRLLDTATAGAGAFTSFGMPLIQANSMLPPTPAAGPTTGPGGMLGHI